MATEHADGNTTHEKTDPPRTKNRFDIEMLREIAHEHEKNE